MAFFIGFPVLRLRGDYLAIATLGFAEIIRIIFLNTQTLTNGSMGVKSIPPTANLLWCFGVAALMVVFMLRLIHSSYGRAFKAIRDDEIAAEAMGINLFKHKMYSFILSAFIAGVGGGLMASVVSAITPNLFRFTLAYDILLIVVLGGDGLHHGYGCGCLRDYGGKGVAALARRGIFHRPADGARNPRPAHGHLFGAAHGHHPVLPAGLFRLQGV